MTDITAFLVISEGRCGSTLLRGLLESHPDIAMGGELFNAEHLQKGELVWPLVAPGERDALIELRRRDPVALLQRLVEIARAHRRFAVGFKLLYTQALEQEELLNHAIATRGLRIIHLTRRDHLRRFVSLLRAERSGKWILRGDGAGPGPRPQVHVPIDEFLHHVVTVERYEADCRAAFAGHPLLELEYEDLAADPLAVGRRAARFLGMREDVQLQVRDRRSGGDALRDAIGNYDELARTLARLALRDDGD